MTNRSGDSSQRAYARVAGAAYILTIVIGVLSGTLVGSNIIVTGDDGSTARNIMSNEQLFRIGIVAQLAMYAGVLVLTGALYIVLEKVNRSLALLAMLLRSAEAIVGIVTVLLSLMALILLNGERFSAAFDTAQLHALVGVFLDFQAAGSDSVLLLIGLGGTVFGYLFYVSRYVPRALAVWGIFSYLSILVFALTGILKPQSPVILETILFALGGTFEMVFGFWLVFKGVDLHAEIQSPGS